MGAFQRIRDPLQLRVLFRYEQVLFLQKRRLSGLVDRFRTIGSQDLAARKSQGQQEECSKKEMAHVKLARIGDKKKLPKCFLLHFGEICLHLSQKPGLLRPVVL